MANMKDLIDNIKIFLEAGVTAGRIRTCTVVKGIKEDPKLIPATEWPFIALDDGGENVEGQNSDSSQNRIYSVVVDMGVSFIGDMAHALDDILDFTNEVKAEFEREANRLLDSHNFAITVLPYGWEDQGSFFRGRTITVQYYDLEEKFHDY